LKSILEYVSGSGSVAGTGKPSDVIQGARDQADAVKRLREDVGGESFLRPVVVDWSNGRAGELGFISYVFVFFFTQS
jgi:hypothetical protein